MEPSNVTDCSCFTKKPVVEDTLRRTTERAEQLTRQQVRRTEIESQRSARAEASIAGSDLPGAAVRGVVGGRKRGSKTRGQASMSVKNGRWQTNATKNRRDTGYWAVSLLYVSVVRQ